MLSSKCFIASLFIVSTVLAGINEDFHHIIQGEAPLEDHHIDLIYESFIREHKLKGLPSESFPKSQDERKVIFQANLQSVIAHNSDSTQTWKKGINVFSDLTEEEFRQHFNIVNAPQDCSATHKQRVFDWKYKLQDIPKNWDWRSFGGVTPVKAQGKCGSCWTFSTIGAIEAHYMIRYNQFRNLSEQQLVDCAGNFDNHGCNGGLPSHAFEYFKYAGGVATEVNYPYKAVDGQCYFTSAMSDVLISGGSVNITSGDEVELMHEIFAAGPVSVCYQVVDGFRDYKSGVYYSDTCKNTDKDVNHAVLAVGFGSSGGVDYWIIKNSWGVEWGDQGYFKIVRGVNMCGIAVCNSYPKSVAPAPKSNLAPEEFLQ